METLTPLPSENPAILQGSLDITNNSLSITYQWNNTNGVFPCFESQETHKFEREIGLWESNCLELFIADTKKSEYYEFNFSLENKWNCFHLSSYREGLKESNDFILLKKTTSNVNEHCKIIYTLELTPKSLDYLESQNLIYNISAISFEKGKQTYWALKHPDTHADFHNKDFYKPLS